MKEVRTTNIFPISYPLGQSWYVLAVNSKTELMVERDVKLLGFEGYTPRAKRNRIIARRKVVSYSPLFTGYVFVKFDIDRDEWTPILNTDGVIDILSNNQIPVRVNADIIERIKRAELAGVFDYSKPSSSFEEGDIVEIKEGPFASISARIKSATAKKRVRIIMQMLGGPVEIDIDAGHLAKAG